MSQDAVLCVRPPWARESEAIVIEPGEDGIPQRVKDEGFVYFLETSVACEVLGVFGDREPTQEEKLRLLIYYAENDAYPDWVYQR
ncbi:MAG: hypothetical protein U0359_26590 [Byssovorax sp.]